MNISDAISHLSSLGLHVARRMPGAMTDRASTDGLTIARAVVLVGDLETLEDVCHIFPLRSRWCYRNWNGIGGRAPDDVHIENLSLDRAVSHAEAFYFGSPLIVDGWIFPIHCHPDWDVDLILASLRDANRYSDSEWRRVRAEHHTYTRTLDDNAQFLAKYREIESQHANTDLRLWMRNDLTDIYFVRRP